MQYKTFRAVQICGYPSDDDDGDCLVSDIYSRELALSRTKRKKIAAKTDAV